MNCVTNIIMAALITATNAANGQDVQKLFTSASKWRVGEAVGEVDSAREQIVKMGEPALDYIFSEKIKTTSTPSTEASL